MPDTRQNWITPTTLEGAAVRLIALAPAHAPDLLTAATPETFRYFSRAPAPFDLGGMAAFIDFLLGPAATVPFCIIDRATERPIGITTYLDIRPQHRGVEIGWTWLTPAARGTRINPEMKLLMLRHAFEALGAIRVCLKTDERNTHSQRAIEKLGARREGVLRHAVIMPDGFRRSTVMYSIREAEWPQVRARLQGRLAGAAPS
ncbi:MAG: GNAT family N-acetyltransferase [Phycisphaerales bacterium JB039]